MNRKAALWLLPAVVVLLFGSARWMWRTREAPSPALRPLPAPSAAAPESSQPDRSGIGFRSQALLEEHYRKHGREFGSVTISEYLSRAQELRDRPAGGDVLELVRADHVGTRYDRASGAFLAFDSDGTIRTFFRPRQGEVYFRRQAMRASPG